MNSSIWNGPGCYVYCTMIWKAGCELFTHQSAYTRQYFEELPANIESLGDKFHKAVKLIATCNSSTLIKDE